VRSSVERALALVVVAGAFAACGGDGQSGVGMANVQTDVVFGADPANLDPGAVTPQEAVEYDALPDQVFEPVARRAIPRVTPSPTAAQECPPAALEEFPDMAAPLWDADEKKAPPREGVYRWQRAGLASSEETGGIPIEIDGFEQRIIRNVEVVSDTETEQGGNDVVFTYEVVQPELGGDNVVITTYQVKSVGAPPTRSVFNPTGAGQDEITAGEPERGLVIKRIQVLDATGATVSEFAPITGLLLMPLRVRPGEIWSSRASDPKSGQQLQLEGKVNDRARVDACGDIIEGWEVTTTLVSSGDGETVERAYDFIVAPQYGAILLSEHISDPNAEAGEGDDVTFTIGQQDPDPLPTSEDES
jgi:hypothetical protein